jgi:hypothetical protein
MILELVGTLLMVALLGVLVIGMLSPIESLHWWSGWSGQAAAPEITTPASGNAPDPVVVYLSGIGSISGDELLTEEANFLDLLEPMLPGGVIVRDVFPYSAAGVGLTGAHTFASFWRLLDRMRMGGDVVLSSLINLRNVFQVAVAADPRYGPIFASGVANAIVKSVTAAGFRPNGTQRLILLGYSGGAQVAVGAAPFLRQLLGVSVHVISLGGVLDSDPGLSVVERLDHLVGDRDVMERVGRIVYPGRWPIARASAWNAARRSGVINVEHLPGMAHNTPGGYMDPNGRTTSGELNPDLTAKAIAAAIAH